MLAVKVKYHQSWFLSSSSTSFRRNYSINSTFIRCSRVLKSVKDLARCMKIQNHLFSFKTDQARLRMISFVSYWATHFLFPLLLSLSCFFFFFFLSLSFLLLSFFSQIIEYSRISEKSCSVGGCDALWRKRERVRACGWRLQNHHTCVIFCQIANTIMCECVWLQEGARKCVRFKIHSREKRCACVCECVWARISMCVCSWVCAHTRAFELSRNFHLLKSKRSTSMGRWGYFFGCIRWRTKV